MPYEIKRKGTGFVVTSPNHPEGHSKMPMSHKDAIAQMMIMQKAEGKIKKAKMMDNGPGGMA